MKWVLRIAVALVLLVAIGLGALALLLPRIVASEAVKSRIQEAARSALGRVDDQLALGREASRKGLSVREVERRVAQARAPRKTGAASRKDPNTRAAEQRLRNVLGTPVEVVRKGRGGSLRIPFKNEADLQRLFDLLLRSGRRR